MNNLIKSHCSLIIFLLFLLMGFPAKAKENSKETFEIKEGKFLLNDKPFVIKAAELHYPRIPKPYWDQRIKMAKALGMNTFCIYVFWNYHETNPDVFDFEGDKDLREFITLCDQNDLKVIVRPGPYVCAEWEMGGLPWWLLKKKDIRLREDDSYFMERVKKFEDAVAEQISDLTIENGGPIIMIQVENEYGAYGINKPYVAEIKNMLKERYPATVMFQCDWSSNFLNNGLDDLIWTMNFGTGTDIDSQFEELKKLRPETPLMCSEYWSGWFDKWGANHETRPGAEMVAGIDEMLSKDISFSLYMTHGGTNFGHWAGANSPGFSPDVTSYDYDAPITESGQPGEKYYALRETLSKYYPSDTLPPIPDLIEPISIDRFPLKEVAPLFLNLPQGKKDSRIRPMEEYDQGYGSILYTTLLPQLNNGAVLNINEVHDYAQVFINGKFIGKLDRRTDEKELILPECRGGEQLEILVEAMGRINFGKAIKDFKGITENVTVTETSSNANHTIYFDDWTIYNLPDNLSFYENFSFQPIESVETDENGRLPRGVYRGVFNVEKPSDTFLNFETWGKGLVYVNGHGLGRIWEIGPQQTLYMPGCWLKEGENEIIVFDITGPKEAATEGLAKPIIDKVNHDPFEIIREATYTPDLSQLIPVMESSFNPGNGWKEKIFNKPSSGRYVTLQILDGFSETDTQSAIAELYMLGSEGEEISRENWKIVYVDSQDMETGNNNGEKIFDLQESTYWRSAPGFSFPHLIVIDMGKKETITGIRQLPIVESGAPGAINNFRIFISD